MWGSCCGCGCGFGLFVLFSGVVGIVEVLGVKDLSVFVLAVVMLVFAGYLVRAISEWVVSL